MAESEADVSRERPDAASVLGSSADQAAQIDQRRAEKERAHRRLVVTRVARAALVIGVVAFLVWLVAFSSVFAIRDGSVRVSMSGEQTDISTAVAVGDAQVGTPLLQVNVGEVEKQILEDTTLQTAHVSRAWPGGLDIVVTARQPVLALVESTGYGLYGDDGVRIGPAAEVPAGLLLVTGPGELNDPQFSEIMTVWDSLPQELRDRVSQIRISGTVMTLTLSAGTTVVWGDDSNSGVKAQVLELLLDQRPAANYDVSDPTRPTSS